MHLESKLSKSTREGLDIGPNKQQQQQKWKQAIPFCTVFIAAAWCY
jgi:hypothetical protein